MTSTYERTLRLDHPLEEGRVLLVDGHSLAYRAYYGMPELTTRSGQAIQAVYGFWTILLKMIRERPSAYTAVVFDADGPTFRHELYSEYKANRKPMPEDLASQFPLLERMLAGLGVPTFSIPGVEADDVLATIALATTAAGLHCLIATSDKDMAQLVSDRVSLLRPSGRRFDSSQQVLDPAGVEAKYGVPPERIVDLLALVGDTSDNVPGVPGVGEKTATRLIRDYASLGEMLDAADDVRNRRVSDSLRAHREKAFLARSLVSLKTDVEVGDVPAACRLRGIDADRLAAFLTEAEFASALNELDLAPVESEATEHRIGAHPVDYRTILEEGALSDLVVELRDAERVSIDLETTGLDPMQAEIVGVAISPEPFIGYYIPVGHDSLDAPAQLPIARVLDALRPIIEDETPELIGQNLKYDVIILSRYGLTPRGISFDSMIASHLSRPEERRHGLDQIALTYLGHHMLTYEQVAGKDGAFAAVPIEQATAYAAEDAEIVQRLYEPLRSELGEMAAADLFRDVEMPLLPVLARMEQTGILLDTAVLEEQGAEIRAALQLIEADLMDIAGGVFNPNSPKQVAEILFEQIGLPVIERTKTGPSTSARVLAELAIQHPLPGKLIEYRELRKLLNTYIDQLPAAVNPHTGRIHTTFHQTATATGRLSSSEPNLQNVPTRTEIGGRIRRAFVPPGGSVFVAADYSQIELRLLAHLSEDEQLIEAFRNGLDLHRLTASRVFEIAEHNVSDEQRNAAKRINFGILYGISPYGLGKDLGIPPNDAKAYIDRFFHAYPDAKAYLDRLVELATERGYAETILGRRRPLPNLTSRNIPRRNYDRRNAINTPIQGGAADLIKLAMIEIDRRLTDTLSARMILQIHDELLFEVEEAAADETVAMIRNAMENVMPLNVPLVVKLSLGADWSQV
ncbi:DNA polymerase I [Candidatus Bipolaricaulota bacterium]|nr:DNA polymerase I [Candidatus Bipolaricaulota bacterium]